MQLEWDDDGLQALRADLERQFRELIENIEIPEGATANEIEEILMQELADAVIEPDPAGVREAAEALAAKVNED